MSVDQELSPSYTLYGNRQAISSGHHLATAAGYAILEAGGNAVDAGCAAGIALTVLCSNEVNFAGVAPMMIRPAAGPTVSIAGLGHWPASIPPDLFVRGEAPPAIDGILCTVVPAGPDAWIRALSDYGTMTFEDVSQEAIRIARDGFAMYEYLANDIAKHQHEYARWPANAAVYLPNGRPPRFGERFVQTDLAATIQHMADEERRARGRGRLAALSAARDAFYLGDIAAAIVQTQRDHGGYLTHQDLAAFESRYEPVVTMRWRDFELLSCGPWCQGPVLLQCLGMLERHGLVGLGLGDVEYVHLVLEVLKAAFADREFRYGDPAHVDVGLEELLSDAHMDRRLADIDPQRARSGMAPPVGAVPGALDMIPEPSVRSIEGQPDTSFVCVVDRWGNVFSATPSDASYFAPVVEGTGIVTSTRGKQSRPDPRHPSGAAPNRRPRLTPNPAMAVRDDGSLYVFGCPGGDMQVQAMLQVFLNTFHFGMDVQAAIDAPRFSTWSFPNSFAPYTYSQDHVSIENRFPDDVVRALADLGHQLELWPPFTRTAAAVEAIYVDRASGFVRAGSDPRQPTSAIVS
ncbi:MAG TPA: gamma-glutamyltransferase [Ilumatobacter sp.]|nr:gamma-glutamyltransferase [Ilumatobacter sp.]